MREDIERSFPSLISMLGIPSGYYYDDLLAFFNDPTRDAFREFMVGQTVTQYEGKLLVYSHDVDRFWRRYGGTC